MENKNINLFDLLSIDYTNLAEKINEMLNKATEKYNKINKYDLDTQEGYEKFINEAAELRKNLNEGDYLFKDTLIKILDNTVEKVMNNHTMKQFEQNNKNISTAYEDLVNKEVERTRKENSNVSAPKNKRSPDIWPSSKLTDEQKLNVWKLVDEFMETMILPYIDEATDKEVINDIGSGLFEYSAWLLKK